MSRAYFIKGSELVWIKTAGEVPIGEEAKNLEAMKNLPGYKNFPGKQRPILSGVPSSTASSPTPYVVTPSNTGV
jgi:hypothetical protein